MPMLKKLFFLSCFLFSLYQPSDAFGQDPDSTVVEIDPAWTQPEGPVPDDFPEPFMASMNGALIESIIDDLGYTDLEDVVRNRPYALRYRILPDSVFEALSLTAQNVIAAQYVNLNEANKQAESYWKTKMAALVNDCSNSGGVSVCDNLVEPLEAEIQQLTLQNQLLQGALATTDSVRQALEAQNVVLDSMNTELIQAIMTLCTFAESVQ